MLAKAKYSRFLPIVFCVMLVGAISSIVMPSQSYAETGELTAGKGAELTTQSYPFLWNLGGKNVYKQGKFTLRFEMHSDYANNRYKIEIRYGGRNGMLMATAEDDVYVPYSDLGKKVNITGNSSKWYPGKYTIVVYTYYYSFGRWCEYPSSPATTFDMTIVSKHKQLNLKIATKKITIKRGQSKMLSYSPKKGVILRYYNPRDKKNRYDEDQLRKLIKMSRKGKIVINKKLRKGTYYLDINIQNAKDPWNDLAKHITVIVK